MKKVFLLAVVLLIGIPSLFAQAVERQLIAKTILFELQGTDSTFLKNEKFIRKVSPSEFKELLFENSPNCIYADTVIFKYDKISWESDVIVKVHTTMTKLPVHFTVTHVGTTFHALLQMIRDNMSTIKYTMKRQEVAAASGNKDYMYVQ